jgi:vacuolar-type H+-ATPase subunit H
MSSAASLQAPDQRMLDQRLKRAEFEIDEILAQARKEAAECLLQNGATDEELESVLADIDRWHLECKAKALTEVRAWLTRSGETAH